MNRLNQQVKIDTTAYDSQIIEGREHKRGYFWFGAGGKQVQIAYRSDEYGNIKSLSVIQALDDSDELSSFVIDSSNYNDIASQIEPMLWDSEEFIDTEHGMTNKDFIYGFTA